MARPPRGAPISWSNSSSEVGAPSAASRVIEPPHGLGTMPSHGLPTGDERIRRAVAGDGSRRSRPIDNSHARGRSLQQMNRLRRPTMQLRSSTAPGGPRDMEGARHPRRSNPILSRTKRRASAATCHHDPGMRGLPSKHRRNGWPISLVMGRLDLDPGRDRLFLAFDGQQGPSVERQASPCSASQNGGTAQLRKGVVMKCGTTKGRQTPP